MTKAKNPTQWYLFFKSLSVKDWFHTFCYSERWSFLISETNSITVISISSLLSLPRKFILFFLANFSSQTWGTKCF